MSNFSTPTFHPETGHVHYAEWLDDDFGRHRYGVRFPDGKIFPEAQCTRCHTVGWRGRLDTVPPVEGDVAVYECLLCHALSTSKPVKNCRCLQLKEQAYLFDQA